MARRNIKTETIRTALTEDIDFHFLLTVMPYLEKEEQYAWLPELFSIIGKDNLIMLCKYAGGETIKIPTLQQLFGDITTIQNFYDIDIRHIKKESDLSQQEIEELNIIRDCMTGSM